MTFEEFAAAQLGVLQSEVVALRILRDTLRSAPESIWVAIGAWGAHAGRKQMEAALSLPDAQRLEATGQARASFGLAVHLAKAGALYDSLETRWQAHLTKLQPQDKPGATPELDDWQVILDGNGARNSPGSAPPGR